MNTKDFKDADWLFPETTKNFTKLPLQYRVIKSFIIKGQKHFEDIIKAYRLIYSNWCNRLLINVALCINWYKHDIPIFKIIYKPVTIPHLLKLLIFLQQGYCALSLANFDRLLIPSNPEVGVLRYKDHYYAFSNKNAAAEFAQNPDQWVFTTRIVHMFFYQFSLNIN